MGTELARKRVPKGTISDVDEGGSGLLGSDVRDLSALFMTAAKQVENDAGPVPFGEDEPVTSGVLDIRALADAYESELERRRADTEDEPPMVSESGLGLLMPMPEPEQTSARPRFAVWALATLALVAATAVATAFIVQRTMQPALAAAAPTAEQCEQLAAAPAAIPAPSAVAAAPVDQPATAVAAPATAVATVASLVEDDGDVAPETPAVTREPAARERAADADDDEDAEARRARREARRAEREREAAEREPPAKTEVAEAPAAPVVEPPEPAPSATPPAVEAKATDKCDEVACLVDPSSACCAKRTTEDTAKVEEKADLPERLSASDVNSGLRPRRGRIESCGDRHGFTGTAKLKLTITPAGKVGSVSVDDGNSAFQSCVAGHVKKASFAESQQGMTLTYPIVFR